MLMLLLLLLLCLPRDRQDLLQPMLEAFAPGRTRYLLEEFIGKWRRAGVGGKVGGGSFLYVFI